MKTKTILLTVITLCMLVGGAGCEMNTPSEKCEFDVMDPINSLEWLKNKIP